MTPFQNESQHIVDVLTNAYDAIEAIDNPEVIHLKSRIQNDLKRHISALTIQLGQNVPSKFVPSEQLKPLPLTKLFGRDLTKKDESEQLPASAPPAVLESPEDIELKELRQRVDELYPKFLATEADQLLDSVSDIEIRGVAKKAGLPVSDDNPKKITTKYIVEIKKAIQQQISHNNNAGTGQ